MLRATSLSLKGDKAYLSADARKCFPVECNSTILRIWMKGLLSIFVPANRTRLLAVAGILVTAIAVTDWHTKPYISLGFLYLFPIIIVGGFLSR